VTFSQDENSVKVWDLARTYKPETLWSDFGDISSLVISGTMIACRTSEGTVLLWDLSDVNRPVNNLKAISVYQSLKSFPESRSPCCCEWNRL